MIEHNATDRRITTVFRSTNETRTASLCALAAMFIGIAAGCTDTAVEKPATSPKGVDQKPAPKVQPGGETAAPREQPGNETPAAAKSTDSAASAAIKVTADQLMADFAADATAARGKYADKVLEITGKAVEVTRETTGVEMTLGDEKKFMACTGFPNDPDVEKLVKPGDTVTVRSKGTLAYVDNSVLVVSKCELIAPKP